MALLLPLVAVKFHGLNRLYVYTWTTIVIAALIIPNKMPQMIYIVFPFILIIAAAAAVWLWEELEARSKNLAIGALIVIILPALLSVHQLCGAYFPPANGQNMKQVLDFFKASVPPTGSIATMLNLQHFSPEVVQFHFYDWPAPVLADTALSDAELTNGEKYYLTIELDENSPCQQTEIIDDSVYRWNDWLKTLEMSGQARLAATKRFERLGLTAKVYFKP
jgi:hypothetical protein